jgi:FkbM family methyltransferase
MLDKTQREVNHVHVTEGVEFDLHREDYWQPGENILYEPDVIRTLLKFLRPGDHCIDCGASLGYHSLIMSRLVHGEGNVLAFEADPRYYDKLNANLDLNDVNNVVTLPTALWSSVDDKSFFVIDEEKSGTEFAGLSSFIHYAKPPVNEIAVTTQPIDALVDKDEHFRVIKIDCEGAEEFILRGAEKLLLRGVDCVIVEFNYKIMPYMETSDRAIRDFMHMLGYDFFFLYKDGQPPAYIAPDININVSGTGFHFNGMFAKRELVEDLWKTEYTLHRRPEVVDLPQKAIDDWVYKMTDGTVRSGPFSGMKMLREIAWKDMALSPMLLGTWEQELHESIEREIERLSIMEIGGRPRIAVIGCAEGYYAVGLAKRLPKAVVYAVDTDDEALRIAHATAEINQVRLTTGADISEVFTDVDLIVMDCEGAEVVYLQPDQFPDLRDATIIVEIHNLPGQPAAQAVLAERFTATHDITAIVEGERNPNQFPFLRVASSALRWLCVSENRPCQMGWFVMRPKHETSSACCESSDQV